jgi:hypothetical protein
VFFLTIAAGVARHGAHGRRTSQVPIVEGLQLLNIGEHGVHLPGSAALLRIPGQKRLKMVFLGSCVTLNSTPRDFRYKIRHQVNGANMERQLIDAARRRYVALPFPSGTPSAPASLPARGVLPMPLVALTLRRPCVRPLGPRWDFGKKLPLRPGTRAVGGVTAAVRAQNKVEPHSGDPCGGGDSTREGGTGCARALGENSLGPAAQEPEETTTTPRRLAADQHVPRDLGSSSDDDRLTSSPRRLAADQRMPRETGSSSDDYRLTSSPRRLAADQHVPRETGSSSDDDRLFAAHRAAATSPNKSQGAGERKGGGDDSDVDDDGLFRTNAIRGRGSSSSAQLPAWPLTRAANDVIVDPHTKRGSKHKRPRHPSSALRGGPLATGPQKSSSVAASSSDASAEKLFLSNGVRGRLMGVAAAHCSEGPRAGSGLKVPGCGRDQDLDNASSDDDDIGTLIDKDLNKRIAVIAAGSGSFRGANPSHPDPNGHGRDEEAYDTEEAPSSDSGSGHNDSQRMLRRAEGPKGRDSALSSSLQNLLMKIETSATNVGGFNDILKDAIYDKLQKSSSVAKAPSGSSVEKVVLSNGVCRPLMGVASPYFSEEPSTSPSRQHTASRPRTSLFCPENYISPGDSSPHLRKHQSYTDKRDFFEGSHSLSQNDLAEWQFNQAIKKRSVKHRRESLRLHNYFESRSQQRDRLFFLATWLVPSSTIIHRKSSRSQSEARIYLEISDHSVR